MDLYYNQNIRVPDNIDEIYEDYDSISSPDFSKYRQAKKTYNMEIVNKLINCVETTLNARLEAIQDLIQSNKSSLKNVKKMYSRTESRVIEINTKANVGRNLISEDIKFFFDLVQGKSKVENPSSYIMPRTKQGSYSNQRKKSLAMKNKRRKSRSRNYGKENVNPNKKRKFFVGGSKATFDEHRKDKMRKRAPVRRRSRSRINQRSQSRQRVKDSPRRRKKYFNPNFSKKNSLKSENDQNSKIHDLSREMSRKSIKDKGGSYLRQSHVQNRKRSGSRRKPKRWEQLYNMALEKDKSRKESSICSTKRKRSRDSITISERPPSQNLSRKNSSYTFNNKNFEDNSSNHHPHRRSRKNLELPPQPKSSAHSRKLEAALNISEASFHSPPQIITQTLPHYSEEESTPSPSLFKNKTDDGECYSRRGENLNKTLKRTTNRKLREDNRLDETIPKDNFPCVDDQVDNEFQMPGLKCRITKDDIFNLLMDPSLTEQEKKFLLQKEFRTLNDITDVELEKPVAQLAAQNQEVIPSAETRLLLKDYNLKENISEINHSQDSSSRKRRGKIEKMGSEEKKQVMRNLEVLDESFSHEVEYIKNQNREVDRSLKKNKLLGDVIDLGEFEMSQLVQQVMIKKNTNGEKKILKKKTKKIFRGKPKSKQNRKKIDKKEQENNAKMLKNIEALERAIEMGITMNDLEPKEEKDKKSDYVSFQDSKGEKENMISFSQFQKRKEKEKSNIQDLLETEGISNFKQLREEALQGKYIFI